MNRTQITFDHLKSLDISLKPHPYNEKVMIAIAQIFPGIEHLTINTADLYNISLLNTHLPNLRSLTFRIIDRYFQRLAEFDPNLFNNQPPSN
jgi:hypothetical protein